MLGGHQSSGAKDNLRHISEPEALTSYVCGQAFHMVDWRREGIDVLNPICADPSELVLHTCLRRFAGDYKMKERYPFIIRHIEEKITSIML